MGQWVVAYCTKPVRDRFVDIIEQALEVADFAMMAERQGLPEEVGYAAQESLRFERLPDKSAVLVHYEHHEVGAWWMRCDHHGETSFIRETIEGQLEGDLPAPVRELMPNVVETIAFELKTTDWSAMGLAIAFQLAMALAKPQNGAGFVDVEGDWWDPKTFREL